MAVRLQRASLYCTLLALLILMSGCSKPGLQYIPSGGSYTLEEAQQVASSTNIDTVKDVRTSDASSLRNKALLELRSNGSSASALADALTKDFPSDTAAVPVRVEAATVDGTAVWLVVEAWGDEDGNLVHRRLWLFDKQTLGIIGSSSFR